MKMKQKPQIRLLSTMLTVIYTLWCGCQYACAQGNETGDSIKINPKFLKELDSAFSFTPLESPIEVPDNVLTREQLHEWVGPVDDAQSGYLPFNKSTKKYDPTDPNRFDSTYFALKMYLVDFCKWQPIIEPSITIPGLKGSITDGLQHYGKHAHSLRQGGVGVSFDFNAFAKYIRPSEIRLRRSRALADSAREMMDKFMPCEGEALYSITDSLALMSAKR